ncbi:MarR family transcriptional regulator [Natrinema longum]|uniref:MarR family transcriptional regulator n=1 Tax=Natrinema longum TaxID=370324 RepID=A0A8A2U8I3_9EURY|nr:MarR family transcriptional regulator [Natrinema longum]MBZ6494125.1 MarR family transcriptional regulator [Natrinema longum]QSW84545.1 MarR family transcriptional regulator [Natrinema longum]
MASQTRRRARIDPVPDDLESAHAKLVYIYLEVAEGATIEELGEILAMKKINILSVLNSLSSAGYVEQAESEYVLAN